MVTGDMVVCWILALPAVAAFYLAYGVVEEVIRGRPTSKVTEPAPHASEPSTIEAPRKADMRPTVRGYDTPELFRHDALIHIHHLESEVAKQERNIQAILAQMTQRE